MQSSVAENVAGDSVLDLDSCKSAITLFKSRDGFNSKEKQILFIC